MIEHAGQSANPVLDVSVLVLHHGPNRILGERVSVNFFRRNEATPFEPAPKTMTRLQVVVRLGLVTLGALGIWVFLYTR